MKVLIFVPSLLVGTLVFPAAANAATSTFGGFRIEVFEGADRLSGHEQDTAKVTTCGCHVVATTTTTTTAFDTRKTGVIGGAEIGYDLPIGNRLVIGGFGSYALPTTRKCDDADGIESCFRARRQIEGGGRLGFKLAPGVMVYGKGSYVRYGFKLDGDLSPAVDGSSTRFGRNGWRAGAGVEIALAQHAYVKIEYNYGRPDRYHATLATRGEGYQESQTFGSRITNMHAVAGFGIRF